MLRSSTSFQCWDYIFPIQTSASDLFVSTISIFLNSLVTIQIRRRKVCAERREIGVAMPPGGRQSRRVRSIAPTEVVPVGLSRILKRLQITRAPEQHVPEDISPITENSTVVTMLCRQNRQ